METTINLRPTNLISKKKLIDILKKLPDTAYITDDFSVLELYAYEWDYEGYIDIVTEEFKKAEL